LATTTDINNKTEPKAVAAANDRKQTQKQWQQQMTDKKQSPKAWAAAIDRKPQQLNKKETPKPWQQPMAENKTKKSFGNSKNT